jgi:hypothetical protein
MPISGKKGPLGADGPGLSRRAAHAVHQDALHASIRHGKHGGPGRPGNPRAAAEEKMKRLQDHARQKNKLASDQVAVLQRSVGVKARQLAELETEQLHGEEMCAKVLAIEKKMSISREQNKRAQEQEQAQKGAGPDGGGSSTPSAESPDESPDGGEGSAPGAAGDGPVTVDHLLRDRRASDAAVPRRQRRGVPDISEGEVVSVVMPAPKGSGPEGSGPGPGGRVKVDHLLRDRRASDAAVPRRQRRGVPDISLGEVVSVVMPLPLDGQKHVTAASAANKLLAGAGLLTGGPAGGSHRALTMAAGVAMVTDERPPEEEEQGGEGEHEARNGSALYSVEPMRGSVPEMDIGGVFESAGGAGGEAAVLNPVAERELVKRESSERAVHSASSAAARMFGYHKTDDAPWEERAVKRALEQKGRFQRTEQGRQSLLRATALLTAAEAERDKLEAWERGKKELEDELKAEVALASCSQKYGSQVSLTGDGRTGSARGGLGGGGLEDEGAGAGGGDAEMTKEEEDAVLGAVLRSSAYGIIARIPWDWTSVLTKVIILGAFYVSIQVRSHWEQTHWE